MPIKPENKKRYPANWKEIRERILKRAENRCERCRAPNGEQIARGTGEHEGTYYDPDGYIRDDQTGKKIGMCRESDYSAKSYPKVVLTIAHLDHTPEHCDDDNLQALCQKCHLNHDKHHHQQNAAATRRSKKGTLELFDATSSSDLKSHKDVI